MTEIRILVAIALAAMTSLVIAQDELPATPEHVVGDDPYPFETEDARYKDDRPPIELPESVDPKFELLTPEEIEFLKSSDARRFTGPAEETVEALDERSPEEVKAWVNAMQDMIDRLLSEVCLFSN